MFSLLQASKTLFPTSFGGWFFFSYQKKPPTNSQEQMDQPSRVNTPHTSLLSYYNARAARASIQDNPPGAGTRCHPRSLFKKIVLQLPLSSAFSSLIRENVAILPILKTKQSKPFSWPLHPPPAIILFLCTPLQQNSPWRNYQYFLPAIPLLYPLP